MAKSSKKASPAKKAVKKPVKAKQATNKAAKKAPKKVVAKAAAKKAPAQKLATKAKSVPGKLSKKQSATKAGASRSLPTSSKNGALATRSTAPVAKPKNSVAATGVKAVGQNKTLAAMPAAMNPQKNKTKSGTLPKTIAPAINHKMPNPEKGITTAKERSSSTQSVQGSKSAPPMRLSVNDNDVIASSKARFGAKDLANFKKNIIEQRIEASEEFDIISEQMLDTSGEFDADNQAAIHSSEQGTDAMEREKTFLHAQRTSDYIKKLDEAIERIDRGTYGICVVCGELIEKGRLEAVPITQKHVDCKNKTQAKKLTAEHAFHEVEEAAE